MTKGSTPGGRSEGGNSGFSDFFFDFPFFGSDVESFRVAWFQKTSFFAVARCGVQMKYSRRKFTPISEDVHAQSHIRVTSVMLQHAHPSRIAPKNRGR